MQSLPVAALALLSSAAGPALAQQLGSFRMPLDETVLFDADGDPATDDDQVRVSGQLGLDVTAQACSSLIAGSGCQDLIGIDAEALGLANLSLSADVGAGISVFQVTNPGLPPIPLMSTPTPIGDLTTSMRFMGALHVAGNVEEGTRFDVGMEVPFGAGFTLAPDLSVGFPTDIPTAEDLLTSPPEIAGNIVTNLTVGGLVAVEFTTTLNGLPLPSPSYLFGPEATLHADPFGDPWWTIDADVNVYIALGILPFWFFDGPDLIASVPVTGIDAGGPLNGPGQQPSERWAETIDMGGDEKANYIVANPNDPTSSYVGIGGNGSRIGLLEVDANGSVMDAWTWSGFQVNAAATSAAGAMLVGADDGDVWFSEWLGNGTFGVSKRISLDINPGEPTFSAERIVALPGGDFMLGGLTSVAGNPNHRSLMRVTAAGEVVWVNQYGPGYLGDSFEDMLLTTDGAIAMVGRYEAGSSRGAVVTKVALDGSVEWSRVLYDGVSALLPSAIGNGTDGKLVVMGRRGGANIPDPPFLIFSREYDLETGDSSATHYHGVTTDNGQLLYGGSVRDRVFDMQSIGAGFAVVGQCSEALEEDAWLWTLGASLSLADCGVFDSPEFDSLDTVRVLPDGGVLAAGHSEGFGQATNRDVLLVRSGTSPHFELAEDAGGISTLYAMSKIVDGASAELLEITGDPLLATSVDDAVNALTQESTTSVTLTE